MAEPIEDKAIRIDYGEADQVPVVYATHMTVQVSPVEFVLSFYQVFPPTLSGPEAEQREQIAKTERVAAHCVGRIAIAAPRMPEFVRVLGDQLKTYNETIRAAMKAAEAGDEKGTQP